jgi:hypothetical protein
MSNLRTIRLTSKGQGVNENRRAIKKKNNPIRECAEYI